jgi:hypothetical protein
MIAPSFWAEARRQHREAGRQITVRRFGWSMQSEADALVMAQQRADEALRRMLAGETSLARREQRLPYNGADGVPIREEVLHRQGETVITRNAYGARCLNTPDTLFADIDFDSPASGPTLLVTLGVLLLGALGLGVTFDDWLLASLVAVVALLFSVAVSKRIAAALMAARGGPRSVAEQRIKRFIATHPDWHLRTYETPAGMRVVAVHALFDPASSEVLAFFRAVGADQTYVRMCQRQRCFRARLTPKPWRIGMQQHLRPRPGVWPIDPKFMPLRERWVAEYEQRSRGHAACRFIEDLGAGFTDPTARRVVELHDRECRALASGLPLA